MCHFVNLYTERSIYVFEQDYIIRLIKEMIRAILKLLFNIDTDNPIEDLLEDKESQDTLYSPVQTHKCSFLYINSIMQKVEAF